VILELTDAATCGTDRLRLSRHVDKEPAELANEFAPGKGFQTQSLQDSLIENAIEQKDAEGTKGRRFWTGRVSCGRIPVRHSAGLDSDLRYLCCLLFNGNYLLVRLLDDEASLACAADVDLNPIRAGLAPTLKESQFTTAQRRLTRCVVGAFLFWFALADLRGTAAYQSGNGTFLKW